MRLSMRLRPGGSVGSRSGLTNFIDEGSGLEGKCAFSGTTMVNGKFSGEIQSTETLIIGEKGVVNANIRAGTLIVRGELVGGTVATDRVELKAGARVVGDLEAPVVIIEEGAFFDGHCRMNDATAGSRERDGTLMESPR